jgi:putative N6-adenine-specific DNA methylase
VTAGDGGRAPGGRPRGDGAPGGRPRGDAAPGGRPRGDAAPGGGSRRDRAATRPLHNGYVVCPPGLEALLAAELQALGTRAVKPERGGVSFRATTRQLYAANLWSRVATRVLVRVAEFEATTFAELERHARALDLEPWLGERRPRWRVSAQRSALYHTDAIAERLAQQWGGSPAEGRAAGPVVHSGDRGDADETGLDAVEQLFVVRNVRDQVSVSVDTSGLPLYKRGWRQEVAKAPLRENLAAAMLLAVGWNGDRPLLDPFCGSGTIAIEAALLALGRPPGFRRGFAFFEWPSFEAGTWASVVGQAVEAEIAPERPLVVIGADRDDGAVAAARGNAERAEVSDHVEFLARAVSATERPAGPAGWVVTNPPYGGRIDHGADLRNLYARFGEMARTSLRGWSVAMLVADRRLAAHSGLSLHEALRFDNGGIDVTLLVGDGRRAAAGPAAGRGRTGGRSGRPAG